MAEGLDCGIMRMEGPKAQRGTNHFCEKMFVKTHKKRQNDREVKHDKPCAFVIALPNQNQIISILSTK